MAHKSDPRWDKPDAHELALAAHLGRYAAHFTLLPSTRAQRRSRAWYWQNKALRLVPAARPR